MSSSLLVIISLASIALASVCYYADKYVFEFNFKKWLLAKFLNSLKSIRSYIMLKQKNILISIGCIIVFLVLTNPTMTNFKEFTGENRNLIRKSNWLIFSIYVNENDNGHYPYSNKYIGICKNFYEIGFHGHSSQQISL